MQKTFAFYLQYLQGFYFYLHNVLVVLHAHAHFLEYVGVCVRGIYQRAGVGFANRMLIELDQSILMVLFATDVCSVEYVMLKEGLGIDIVVDLEDFCRHLAPPEHVVFFYHIFYLHDDTHHELACNVSEKLEDHHVRKAIYGTCNMDHNVFHFFCFFSAFEDLFEGFRRFFRF